MQTGDTDNLLDLAQQGNIAARDSLMMRYRDRLRQVINVFLDPRLSARVDSSDVLQEALAQAANRLPQYLEERPIDFYYWLRAIVRDEMTRMHRRHLVAQRRSIKREQPLERLVSDASAQLLADRLVSDVSSPSQRERREERKSQVQQALNQITESDRELLLMRCVEQMSIRAIAAVIGISESAVKGRLRRALERMGRQLRNART